MATEFGKLLRIIRINSGDGTREMANKLNISSSYLSAIENGKRNIPADMESRLSKAYPLTDKDREKIRSVMMNSSNKVKINLTDFGEKRKALVFAIIQGSTSEEMIDKIYNLVFKKKKTD